MWWIKNAISSEQAEQTAASLWDFEEKKPKDSSTWYSAPRAEIQMKELAGTGMVEVYNNQYLWNNRQSQKVYDAFVDVWGTEKLWVTIDRANLNFPIKKRIWIQRIYPLGLRSRNETSKCPRGHRTFGSNGCKYGRISMHTFGSIKIMSVGNSRSTRP